VYEQNVDVKQTTLPKSGTFDAVKKYNKSQHTSDDPNMLPMFSTLFIFEYIMCNTQLVHVKFDAASSLSV
jgi:hypothetical protein